MAKADDKPQYHALYVKGDDHPTMIFREDQLDTPEIQAARKVHGPDRHKVLPVAVNVKLDRATRQGIAELQREDEPEEEKLSPEEEVRKGEIKTAVNREQTEAELRKQSEAELKQESKAKK